MVLIGNGKVASIERSRDTRSETRDIGWRLAVTVLRWPRPRARSGRRRGFWATKLNVAGWGGRTADPKAAHAQLAASFDRLGRDKIDLIQVHNVADLATQFPILRDLKEQGRVRYVGTTSTFKGQYDTLERFMRTERPDFIGIDYSVDNLSAEERILPLAQERKVAV